jgi:hypothetical protein
MTFKIDVFGEPPLEFGEHGQEIDIRLGLTRWGPLEPERASTIRLGIIGTADCIEGFERWFELCRLGMGAKRSRQPNLFLPFPGLGQNNPFRCSFELDAYARRAIPLSDIDAIVKCKQSSKAVTDAVELYANLAESIAESPAPPNVIICTLPVSLIERVVNEMVVHDASDDEDEDDADAPDFRDVLKAKTIHLKLPLQLVWPTTWDESAKIARKLQRLSGRRVQDPATRAWNLFNALYYKAGYVPWRLPRDPAQLTVSYVGVSFYRDSSGQRLLTSTAQLFDERGQGLILRGGRAQTDKNDRHPYLAREDAYDLLKRSLRAYHSQHYHAPARVVLYKSSMFQPEEVDGFEEALSEAGVQFHDFLWVSERNPFRLMRDGAYPPLRGTYFEMEDGALLYTRGSVPYFRTYPGMYVPQPILLRPFRRDSTIKNLSKETLALTKMNWNSTQFDGALPITLRAARYVGKVLKHVSAGSLEAAEYRFYI